MLNKASLHLYLYRDIEITRPEINVYIIKIGAEFVMVRFRYGSRFVWAELVIGRVDYRPRYPVTEITVVRNVLNRIGKSSQPEARSFSCQNTGENTRWLKAKTFLKISNKMGFGDLKSRAGLEALNSFLADRSYIEG